MEKRDRRGGRDVEEHTTSVTAERSAPSRTAPVDRGTIRSADVHADPFTPDGILPGRSSSTGDTHAPALATPRLPSPGAIIQQYEIIRELGRGGMGAVFLARDTRLGRRVAIKFLYSGHADLTARFIREARTTASCGHENIVVIYEVSEHDGQPFMVLEYLEGIPLSKELDGRTLSPTRAVELMVPVVRALTRAHEHDIVHRDLKPDNILVTDSGTVKVLDFGIAKVLHDPGDLPASNPSDPSRSGGHPGHLDEGPAEELTRQGAIIGTLPYMSPEQWGADSVDHRTDIWAVGIMLFRMLAGKHPLAPRQGREFMITGLLDLPMPDMRDQCPTVPDELADIVNRCLIKPKERRMGSARELLQALERFLPRLHGRKLHADESPYAGLESFQESDAHRFFGRAQEIAAATTKLRNQPLLAVAGPSGVGKSSFVRAGIAPALELSGDSWTTIIVRPGRHPVASLAHAVTQAVSSSATTVADDLFEQQTVHERLYREPGYLGAVLRSRARSRGQRVLVFVDQFEELYTLVTDPQERLAFTTSLASIADDATSPLRLIVALRSDFLDQVTEDPHLLAELTRGLFFLAPPGRDGLRDALLQPADMAGYRFESSSMVEHMLDHLEHTPGALPLLQFAASRLWDLRDRERKLLTDDSYRQVGGIAGALASHADTVLGEFPSREQTLVRALFLRLVTPERTRAVVPAEELSELSRSPGDIQRLIGHLVRARLLVIQTGAGASGASTVELVHESLIHGWPSLGRWLDENQDDAMFLEQLRNAAQQWHVKGRPGGLLWRGQAMEEARVWARHYLGELPPLQGEYLQAVFALAARGERRRRVAFVSVVGLLSLLVAAAVIALVTIREAEKKASTQAAEARRQLSLTRVAEQTAVQAKTEAVRANDELSGKNQELSAALRAADSARREAEAARSRAEREKQKARRDRRRARKNERRARAAEARARKANEELQAALAKERLRIEQLEKRGVISVIPDVDVKPGASRASGRHGQ